MYIMKNNVEIKKKLYDACLLLVAEKQKTINTIIQSNKKALYSETKSSVGDKHETGRAMLQLEMEKAGQQLTSIIQMKDVLSRIENENFSEVICLGSLILTNTSNYYLSISAGKIIIDFVEFFAVSTNSPIGKQLLGKKIGDKIPFNNATILGLY
jgi:hypothetical protein